MGRSLLRSQPLTTGDLCLRSRDAERIPARGKAGEQGGRARAPGRRERGRGWKIESDDSSSSNDVESTVPFFFPLRGPPDADPLPSAPSSLALSHSLSLSPPLELFEAPPLVAFEAERVRPLRFPFPHSSGHALRRRAGARPLVRSRALRARPKQGRAKSTWGIKHSPRGSPPIIPSDIASLAREPCKRLPPPSTDTGDFAASVLH